MTKELYNELMNKRVITDTKMTLDYINENKLKLEDIITVPAILEMYLGKEEIVEEDIIVDEIDSEETNNSDEPVTDEVESKEEIVEEDIIVDEIDEVKNDETNTEETNNSDEPVTDEVESKEEILEEESASIVEEKIVKEKPKTKKK